MSLFKISSNSTFCSNCDFDIFLSHSGKQKQFVYYLFHELQLANYRVFFDVESISRGSYLDTTIIDAIKHCRLGVLVISKDFVTSKWPMLELQHLMATPGCEIYPIFYELQPGDLVNKQNLKKWQKHWDVWTKEEKTKLHNHMMNINYSFVESLQRLKLIAGTIIPVGPSEQTQYEKLNKIVKGICQILPPLLFYNNPFIKGKENSGQAIQDHYKRILQENTDGGALVLGVAGIGGSGKTTLCETMVDYYNQHEFPGRSVLLEFPTDEVDQEKLIPQFKIVLQKFTRAHKLNIKSITDIKQALSLLKQFKKVGQYFLAIDNVCEWSELYVEQMLKILIGSNTNDGNTTKPKVIVTSRSEALLIGMGVVDVINVPELKEEEALDILLSNGRCWDLYKSKQFSYETDIKSILSICYTSCAFHPLLLKTLGNIMSQVIHKDGCGWEDCIDDLKNICLGLKQHQGETKSIFQSKVERIIFGALKVNYSYLEENLKNTFLDIAILYPQCIDIQNFPMLKGYKDIGSVKMQVIILEQYGLCRLFWRRRCPKNEIESIEIHDLYKVLAKEEAKRNGRFLVFLDGKCNIAPSSLSKVTRIVNQTNCVTITNLEGLECSQLQLDRVELLDLHEQDIKKLYVAWRHATNPSAHSSFERLLCNVKNNVGRLIGQNYEWRNVLPLRNDLCLDSLSILKLACGDKITRLDALRCAPNLRSLKLENCHALKDIKGIEKLKRLEELILECDYWERFPSQYKTNANVEMPNLSGCLQLTALTLVGFEKLKSLTDLHCPSSLQRLELEENPNLVDVDGIGSFGFNLEDISIRSCQSLKQIPYVALPKLESLLVYDCDGLEVMMPGGVLSDKNFPCVRRFDVQGCRKLTLLPRIAKTSGFESLDSSVWSNSCVFDFYGSKLGSDIIGLNISVSREQMMFSNTEPVAVSGSTNLQKLIIYVVTNNLSVESTPECNIPARTSLSFLSELPRLYHLDLEGFDFISTLEELSCLRNLEFLRLKNFAILERIPDLSYFKNLSVLKLIGCHCVKDLPGLEYLEDLVNVELRDCRSLRRLPHKWSSPSFRHHLSVYGCPALENFQDFLKNWRSTADEFYLTVDYDSCCSSGALDLSNLTCVLTLTLHCFPASSLSNFRWPKRVNCLQLIECNMQYRSLDLSNLTVEQLLLSGCTDLINLCKWPQTLRELIVCSVDELRSLHSFPTSLEIVDICHCKSFQEIGDLSNHANLRDFFLDDCSSVSPFRLRKHLTI